MELYEQIISKNEVHSRFVWAVTCILRNGIISSKSGLAESLGVKPSKFSEVLNGRMKAGVDMIAIMCDRYYVSPDWILMGRGTSVFRNTELPPYNISYDESDDTPYHEKPKNSGEITIKQNLRSTDSTALALVNTIQQQAEEIGRLKERVALMERTQARNETE